MATSKNEKLQKQDEEFTMAGKAVQDKKGKKKKHMKKHMKSMCKHCKGGHKTSEHLEKGKEENKDTEKTEHMKKGSKHGKHKKHMPSKGHKPKGAHGRAAVKALGRTKTTGNFAKIEKAKGKGAAISAYQHALAKHQGHKSGKKETGREMLKRGMSKMKH